MKYIFFLKIIIIASFISSCANKSINIQRYLAHYEEIDRCIIAGYSPADTTLNITPKYENSIATKHYSKKMEEMLKDSNVLAIRIIKPNYKTLKDTFIYIKGYIDTNNTVDPITDPLLVHGDNENRLSYWEKWGVTLIVNHKTVHCILCSHILENRQKTSWGIIEYCFKTPDNVSCVYDLSIKPPAPFTFYDRLKRSNYNLDKFYKRSLGYKSIGKPKSIEL